MPQITKKTTTQNGSGRENRTKLAVFWEELNLAVKIAITETLILA